jgi:hypothetical protein
MEIRHQQRKHLFLYLEILEQGTHRMLGHLGDISDQGMMIIAEHPLPLFTTLKIQIRLPDSGEFAKPFITVTVETRWAKRDVNPDLHCIGCRFLDLSEDDVPVVKQVGELLSFEQ